jgi:hypothetical protein
VSWLLLATVEILVTSSKGTAAISSGSVIAFLIVSLFAWSVTVPWPRLTGGLGWLVIGALAALALPSASDVSPLTLSITEPHLTLPLLILLYPWSVAGRSLSRSELASSIPALVAALMVLVMACSAVRRLNVTLEAAQ